VLGNSIFFSFEAKGKEDCAGFLGASEINAFFFFVLLGAREISKR
jgi:hypothetical protein